MHIHRFLVTASLSIALATAAGVSPAAAACDPVAAKATTTWIADTGVEVGEVEGLINGPLYLRYSETTPVDTGTDKPNMVIQTKDGDLYLWVQGQSTATSRSAWSRSFTVVSMDGTGIYAGVSGDLHIDGQFWRGTGGEYAITGTLCVGTRELAGR